MNQPHSSNIHLEPYDNQRIAALCGAQNETIRKIETSLGVAIHSRGNHFQITGSKGDVETASQVLHNLYAETSKRQFIPQDLVHLYLKGDTMQKNMPAGSDTINKDRPNQVEIQTKAGVVKGYTANQRKYLENIANYDINFSVGPAGTGKTYLAVASAVDALEKGRVRRILLVRPAVEAGEKLGFLPGGLEQKIEPYLKPLYDALFEMLGFERVGKLIEATVIEVAPLAYMRGRTLNDSFIILDESQNTTTEQMKMFLTRIGFNSKAIITGDITQVDLPKGKKSGLVEATEVLKGINEICFTFFDSKDVVRHALVQRIIEAYEDHEKNKTESSDRYPDDSD